MPIVSLLLHSIMLSTYTSEIIMALSVIVMSGDHLQSLS